MRRRRHALDVAVLFLALVGVVRTRLLRPTVTAQHLGRLPGTVPTLPCGVGHGYDEPIELYSSFPLVDLGVGSS